MPPKKWKTEEQLRAVRNEAARRSWRLQKLRAADNVMREAACLLAPKSRCVAYYRKGLQRRGYTRDAQQWAVEHLVGIADARIIDIYEEAEDSPGSLSWVQKERPQLDAAIRKCQAMGAVLVIAKLGLTQTSGLLFRLAESGIHFVACDKPNVNHRTVAALAVTKRLKEIETSDARKKSVAAAKARGVRFGPAPSVCRAARKLATESWRARAKKHALEAIAFVDIARRQGYRTNISIAEALNACGARTVHGNLWTDKAVANLARWHHTAERPSAMLRFAAEAALQIAVKKSEPPAASAPGGDVPPQSGFPGRPNSRPLVRAELRRRWAKGERHPSRKRGGGESALQWGKVLSEWLATAHPGEPPMHVSAARQALAFWLRELDKRPTLAVKGRSARNYRARSARNYLTWWAFSGTSDSVSPCSFPRRCGALRGG